MSTDPPPIIDYESPPPDQKTAFLPVMMRWRSACGWCFLLGVCSIVGGFYLDESTDLKIAQPLICVAGMLVCSIFTLIYMGKAAAEVSTGYAARQVVLAILLIPIFLLGIFAMPMMVQSDLLKWRRVEVIPQFPYRASALSHF